MYTFVCGLPVSHAKMHNIFCLKTQVKEKGTAGFSFQPFKMLINNNLDC